MTNSQAEFVERFPELMSKTQKSDIGFLVRFWSLFRSDDIELFNKFKNDPSNLDNIINLYAQRYGLDAEKDIEEILYKFLDNAVKNGFSYHLNSSANRSTILSLGLGISAIGLKTEERQDYEILQDITSPELFKKLEPFHGDKKGSKVYYSNIPILNARYGEMPEWIKELKLNHSFVDYESNQEAREFVEEILKKYSEKYDGKTKDFFVLPFMGKVLSEEDIKYLISKGSDPKDIMRYIFSNILEQKDAYYTGHIAGQNIICIDEKCALHFLGKDNEIKTINSYEENRQMAGQTKFILCGDAMKHAINSDVSKTETSAARNEYGKLDKKNEVHQYGEN